MMERRMLKDIEKSKEQLVNELENHRQRVSKLEHLEYDLGERVKELKCIYVYILNPAYILNPVKPSYYKEIPSEWIKCFASWWTTPLNIPKKAPLIQFSDPGIGIHQEELPKISNRFFRADEVRDIQGIGLGLTIAKELVALHKGKIFAESVHGKGSIFNVFLPRLERQPIIDPDRESFTSTEDILELAKIAARKMYKRWITKWNEEQVSSS